MLEFLGIGKWRVDYMKLMQVPSASEQPGASSGRRTTDFDAEIDEEYSASRAGVSAEEVQNPMDYQV